MTKPIKISTKNWEKLLDRLRQDYPPSVTMIRQKMKSKLGFVPRDHLLYDDYFTTVVYLDFYDEPKKTMFILKYSEYLTTQS